MTNKAPLELLAKPWKPHEYQKKAVKFLLDGDDSKFKLWLDPGLGKTSITLAALKILLDNQVAKRILIVAPLRVCHSVWPVEIQDWLDFNKMTYTVLHGPKKEARLKEDVQLYIINFEGLKWLTGATWKKQENRRYPKLMLDLSKISHISFDTLVVDELSRFKDSQSMQSKIMRHLLPMFQRRWGLTGSPASNSLMALFGQTLIIDNGRTFGKYITHYRAKYFTQTRDGFGWNLQEGAAEKIYEAVKPLVLRMAAADYLDMPELLFNNILVDLPDKARKLYKQLEKHFVAEFDDKQIDAVNAGAKSMKLRQIASGGLYVDESVEEDIFKQFFDKSASIKRTTLKIHDAKTQALVELVDSLQGHPVLVAYWFKHDLERIYAAFGDIPTIGGGTSQKNANLYQEQWNAGELPILLGHPLSMAHGLNLQKSGSHICFYSLDWNYELYDQFIKRIWRQGAKNRHVFVHHIVAHKTIDYVLLKVLQSKSTGQNALFDALKEYARSVT